MPTPLETYLAELKSAGAEITMDADNLAIGEDNQWSPRLLEGIKAHFPATAKSANLPNCLALYLVSRAIAWSKFVNMTWLEEALKSYAPKKVYVFHAKCTAALLTSGVNSVTTFQAAYTGNRKDTYDEVVAVLAAGYTRITKIEGGCLLEK